MPWWEISFSIPLLTRHATTTPRHATTAHLATSTVHTLCYAMLHGDTGVSSTQLWAGTKLHPALRARDVTLARSPTRLSVALPPRHHEPSALSSAPLLAEASLVLTLQVLAHSSHTPAYAYSHTHLALHLTRSAVHPGIASVAPLGMDTQHAIVDNSSGMALRPRLPSSVVDAGHTPVLCAGVSHPLHSSWRYPSWPLVRRTVHTPAHTPHTQQHARGNTREGRHAGLPPFCSALVRGVLLSVCALIPAWVYLPSPYLSHPLLFLITSQPQALPVGQRDWPSLGVAASELALRPLLPSGG